MTTVVFDADNTLWPGLLIGGDPPALYPGVTAMLKELHKRKHSLICCSRNDPGALRGVLHRLGIADYFDAILAGWGAKSGLLTGHVTRDEPFLYFDDEEFNCVEIMAVWPRAQALRSPVEDWLVVLDHPALAPVGRAVTREDEGRVQLLREAAVRSQAEDDARARDAYEAFLRASDLRLTIYPTRASLPDHARALDLLNRTNELRTVAQRYDSLPHRWLVGASLVDRFGDYGLIAMAVLDWAPGPTAVLHDLAVSCRTMGRGVGTALVAWIAEAAYCHGAVALTGHLRPSDRNSAMRDLYATLGFARTAMTNPAPGFPVHGPRSHRFMPLVGETETWTRPLLADEDLPQGPPTLAVLVAR